MRDYTAGALEALNWVHHLFKEGKEKEEILREIEELINAILKGIATDFKYRMEAIA